LIKRKTDPKGRRSVIATSMQAGSKYLRTFSLYLTRTNKLAKA